MSDNAKSLAEKIARKAAGALATLQREMDIMQWEPEFRAIMWEAVAHHASLNAEEARTLLRTSAQPASETDRRAAMTRNETPSGGSGETAA